MRKRQQKTIAADETRRLRKAFTAALNSVIKNFMDTDNPIVAGEMHMHPPYTFVQIKGVSRFGLGFSKYNPNDIKTCGHKFDPVVGLRLAFQAAMRDFTSKTPQFDGYIDLEEEVCGV